MTDVVVVGGGPSHLHESRVETLETLATLGGFEYGPNVLLDGSRPDVLRLRRSDSSLFIGDAKATETAGNSETYERLGRYVAFIATWTQRGCSSFFTLAVDTLDEFRWLSTVRALAQEHHGGALPQPDVVNLDATTTVVRQEFVRLGP